MSETVIALSNVRKSYGKHRVLSDVSMSVNKGDIYGLIGKNGAGKPCPAAQDGAGEMDSQLCFL